MVNRIDANKEHLISRSLSKKIEDIELTDLKFSMKEIAMAEVIEFTCNSEKKVKLLKHRWSTGMHHPIVGSIRDL